MTLQTYNAHPGSEASRMDAVSMPIATVLLRVAQEAQLLSQKAIVLDTVISKSVTEAGLAVNSEFQIADLLRQELDGLVKFLTMLPETLDADGYCTPGVAAKTLPLQSQAMRLSASVMEEGPAPNGPPELFD